MGDVLKFSLYARNLLWQAKIWFMLHHHVLIRCQDSKSIDFSLCEFWRSDFRKAWIWKWISHLICVVGRILRNFMLFILVIFYCVVLVLPPLATRSDSVDFSSFCVFLCQGVIICNSRCTIFSSNLFVFALSLIICFCISSLILEELDTNTWFGVLT